MARDKSWIDYANLGTSIAAGVIGIGVAVWVSRSTDQISQNGLILTTATFLLDDSPRRQMAGVEMVRWLSEKEVTMPRWTDCLTSQIARHAAVAAPTSAGQHPIEFPPSNPSPRDCDGVVIPGGPAGAPQGVPDQQVANQLFAALGGVAPRLFIEIAEEGQRDGATALRRAVEQIKLSDQPVIAPAIERVGDPPKRVELRFLKRGDESEAHTLAGILSKLLSLQVPVNDKSGTFGTRADVKARTYELWFPSGQTVNLSANRS